MSKYQATIKRTGTIIYSSENHDMSNEYHCWFSSPDGNSRDCMFVMDNKQFNRMLEAGEVELIEDLKQAS